MSFPLDPSWHLRSRNVWFSIPRAAYLPRAQRRLGMASRRARPGLAPVSVALEEEARYAVARLLAQAGALRRSADAREPEWVFELFGPAPRRAAWRREAARLIARLRLVRGWKAEPVRRSVAPLVRLLALPPERWPSVEELVASALRSGVTNSLGLAAIEAYVRAGRRDLALALCRARLLGANQPERAWRTWATLGYLHLEAGEPALAQGAFEAAAECDSCGVPVLVEAFAGSLLESDERAVCLAAARLELLISPGHADFRRAVALVRSRGGLHPERLTRWRKVIGPRPSAAHAVLTALA